MKLKKILLFILIFLFFLLLSSNVNAFTFTSQSDGQEYTVPDLSTVDESYQQFLDNGYILQNWAVNKWNLYVLSDISFFYYREDDRLHWSGDVYKFSIDTTLKDSWGSASIVNSSTWAMFDSVKYYGASIYTDNNKTDIFYDHTYDDFIFPYIANTDIDLTKGKNDYFLILPGSISDSSDITFNIYSENDTNLELLYTTILNNDSDFYKSVIAGSVLEFWYEVPVSSLLFDFSKGTNYIFNLSGYAKEEYSINKKITFKGLSETDIYNGLNVNINNQTQQLQNSINQSTQEIQSSISSSTSEITNSIDKQTQVQEEQVETSKGIWGTLKDLLSFINPFSENFFVYKLIDLLINALKSLFIPSSDFFNNWVSDLNSYFSYRFGLLYYPISLVIDFLTRVYNISNNLSNGFVISFPNLEFMGTTLINGYSFDFNMFLSNEIFSNIYNVYLICVDVVLIFGLIVLCKNTFVDIFGGKFVEDVVNISTSDERSYKNYERSRDNVKRYNSEHGGNNK